MPLMEEPYERLTYTKTPVAVADWRRKKTRIWTDRWISGNVASPETTVSSLFVNVLQAWNTQLLLQIFHAKDVEMISSISLVADPKLDALIWSFTSDEAFIRQQQQGNATISSWRKQWNCIWEAKALNKQKHFIRRATNNSLPTRDNLQ